MCAVSSLGCVSAFEQLGHSHELFVLCAHTYHPLAPVSAASTVYVRFCDWY